MALFFGLKCYPLCHGMALIGVMASSIIELTMLQQMWHAKLLFFGLSALPFSMLEVAHYILLQWHFCFKSGKKKKASIAGRLSSGLIIMSLLCDCQWVKQECGQCQGFKSPWVVLAMASTIVGSNHTMVPWIHVSGAMEKCRISIMAVWLVLSNVDGARGSIPHG